MISFEIIVEYLKFFQMKIELDEKNTQNVQIDMQDMLLKTIHITARPEGFEPLIKSCYEHTITGVYILHIGFWET